MKEKDYKEKVEKDGKEVIMNEQTSMISIANANAKEKEMITRKDKVAEAHRLRAAASVDSDSADSPPTLPKSTPDSWSLKTLPLTGKLSSDEPEVRRPMPALTKDPYSSSSVSVSTSKMSVHPTGGLGPSLTMVPNMTQSRSTNGKIHIYSLVFTVISCL